MMMVVTKMQGDHRHNIQGAKRHNDLERSTPFEMNVTDAMQCNVMRCDSINCVTCNRISCQKAYFYIYMYVSIDRKFTKLTKKTSYIHIFVF